MQDLKQAYQLAMYELRTAKISYFGSVILYLLISLLFLVVDGKGKTIGWTINDILLMVIFCFAPYYMKPKEFQLQKISGDLWASPSVILLRQLPIKENVLIWSRLIVYSFYSLLPQIILLIALYLLSSNYREIMTPTEYMIFSIIWLAIGIIIGFSMAASDVGEFINPKSMIMASIIIITSLAIIYFIFYRVLEDGIVRWTIYIASEWSFLSIVISIIVTILSVKYWIHYMKKKMTELDYL
ncbi:hypothetical protein [Oceanobacillus chungangensis]|uniref:Uncharacterized protein n=1 Tax=Oceanobacillus chungangensis TaxID=1229152 RepID=A0A3D8PYP5_9BACI|nr:hypothetical protein [Oceanobacillus chungangensis]RDW20441.1 hypothetical protein CWR45_04175 [Oceanobacillus chungangensis]